MESVSLERSFLKKWHKWKTEHTNQQYQGWDKRPYYMSEDDKDHKTYQINECENSGKEKSQFAHSDDHKECFICNLKSPAIETQTSILRNIEKGDDTNFT